MCEKKSRKVEISLGNLDNSCFVAMPFDRLFTVEYENVIRPAIEKANLRPVRGDEIYSKPRIVDDIWKSIRSARVVIGELTHKNPNVLYEIGLAHAIGKTVIIITRNEEDVPFDLKSLRYLYYDINDPHWGANLETALLNMLKSVLHKHDVTSYLEDINPVGLKAFPPITSRSLLKKKQKEPALSLAGLWKSKITEDSGYDLRLSISQEGTELSGIATVSFFTKGVASVVQEILVGQIDQRNVSLVCVNYTYIVQGKSSGYSMDSYNLKLSEDGNTLTGKGKDNANSYNVCFTKEDSPKNDLNTSGEAK